MKEDWKKFRKRAMEVYGYGKGSLSLAVEDAIRRWLMEPEPALQEVTNPGRPSKRHARLAKPS